MPQEHNPELNYGQQLCSKVSEITYSYAVKVNWKETNIMPTNLDVTEVLVVMSMIVAVFWDVTPSCLVLTRISKACTTSIIRVISDNSDDERSKLLWNTGQQTSHKTAIFTVPGVCKKRWRSTAVIFMICKISHYTSWSQLE
jgi:hypothetical protein